MATVEELDWLLAQGADPGAQVHPVRREYIGLLEEMGGLAYPYRLVFFYFLNRLFLEAWNAHVEGEGPWQELAQHWSAPEFQALLFDLEVMARGALEGLGPGGGGPLPEAHPGDGAEDLEPSPLIPSHAGNPGKRLRLCKDFSGAQRRGL
jgi:hypothetical protein